MKIHRIVKSLRVARFNKNFNLVPPYAHPRMYIKPEIQYVYIANSTTVSSISRWVIERSSFVPREDNSFFFLFRYKNKYPLEFVE